MTMKFGFGQPLTRKEDDTLLRGAGRYIADVAPEATLHAVVVRSPHAHARFRIGDLGRVRAMPGVRLVLTAADIGHLGPLPTPGLLPDVEIKIPPHSILAREVARYVGDSVAFVVADTLAAAKDAAEAVEIDWQPLPHVTGAIEALKKGAPQVWAGRPGNLAFEVPRLVGPATAGVLITPIAAICCRSFTFSSSTGTPSSVAVWRISFSVNSHLLHPFPNT